eukprot:TRINITY_DN10298_c0_g1_i2.p1 TRINITY_DN10298_c0_g1~~TRINITY_DN10298_c0_g1_i2.p1  ORF type:complete len:237 (+),score=65.86 TRINITY_DN10298_c0_g1_i2:363-1073(+)
MYEVIAAQSEPVTLIVTGCHTNVALLFSLFPEVKEQIEEVVMLGGAIGIGNITPAAEFNILIDPEAAKIVFESGVPIVMVPLEVSHTALVTPQIKSRIAQMGTPYSVLAVDLLSFFEESYRTVFNFEFPPLHDPLAVAYVIHPEIFTATLMRVDIETSSELSSGRTLCDIFQMSKLKKNALVATKVDVEAFWNLQIDAIKRANAVSKLNVIAKAPQNSDLPDQIAASFKDETNKIL